MKTQVIDNGFLLISKADAKRLNAGKLPKDGYESLVFHEGKHYWLARTRYDGKQRWSIRHTKWHLVNGVATLGGKRQNA